MGSEIVTTTRPRWAPRVAPDRIRALYRSEARGLLDEDLLTRVGWALWERAGDIVTVSSAVHSGSVTCPQCGGDATRQRRAQAGPTGPQGRPACCEGCGWAGDWSAARDAARGDPRCLRCFVPLSRCYRDGSLTCAVCGYAASFQHHQGRLRSATRLPCPQCFAPLRRPVPTDVPARPSGGEEVACPHCGRQHAWREVRARARREPTCTCGGALLSGGSGLQCARCRRSWTPAAFAERLSRRRTGPCPTCGRPVARPRDVVLCSHCGWEGLWTLFRRTWQGEGLLTGFGVPACAHFHGLWPAQRRAGEQMILVDSFLHELHSGPLAPLLIAGRRDRVFALLDEIGGICRPPR